MKFVDLSYQYSEIQAKVEKRIMNILQSGQYVSGKEVERFENRLASYLGVEFCIGVSNGTDALIIALEALGIGRGDEVITSPFTFFGTAESIVKVGATPVFVDIDPETYTIDPEKVKQKISERTKAIIPIHIFGNVSEQDKINEIARENNIYVVEDACQAIGASYKGKMAGTMSDIGCFSFFLTKNLGAAGEAGAIVTSNIRYAILARALRAHGAGKYGAKAYELLNDVELERKDDKYRHYIVGHNSRMDEIQAGFLDVKLDKLDDWITIRRKNAEKYRNGLSKKFKLQKAINDVVHSYHIFSVECEDRSKVRRILEEKGIETGIHYPVPLHMQPAFQKYGWHEGSFPVSENLSRKVLSLPIYPGLRDCEIENIIEIMNNTI